MVGTPRERAREQTLQDITRIGREHLAAVGAAALSLRLIDRVHNTFSNPVEIASCLADTLQLCWQAVLDVLVFAPAAFQNEPYVDVVLFPLFKMNHRRSRAEIVPGIGTCQ